MFSHVMCQLYHVLTKETSGNRFSVVILTNFYFLYVNWPAYHFYPTVSCFYARDSQHYKLMEWKEIGQSADMCGRRISAVPDVSTRVFTLQRQSDAYRSRPLANTSRCGLSVPDEPDAVCTRATRLVPLTVRVSGKIGSVNTA